MIVVVDHPKLMMAVDCLHLAAWSKKKRTLQPMSKKATNSSSSQ
jgi:hypothetical protein